MQDIPQHPTITVRRGSRLYPWDYWLTDNGNPVNLTGATFHSQIKVHKLGPEKSRFEFDIVDAANGHFKRREWTANLEADRYVNDLVIVLADGTPIPMYDLTLIITQNTSEWS